MIAMTLSNQSFVGWLWACVSGKKESKNVRPPLELSAFCLSYLLCFKLEYYSLISILNPATQPQYNFILWAKFCGGKEKERKKANCKKQLPSPLHRTQQFSYHIAQRKMYRLTKTKAWLRRAIFWCTCTLWKLFPFSFLEGRIFTCALTEVTTSAATQSETVGRSTQRYLLWGIRNPNSFPG